MYEKFSLNIKGDNFVSWLFKCRAENSKHIILKIGLTFYFTLLVLLSLVNIKISLNINTLQIYLVKKIK